MIGRESGVLKDRNIAALSTDASGRLWIGYFDRGLQILDPTAQRSVEDLEDDHLFCVNRIAQDTARGSTAVADSRQLVLFSSSTSQLARVISQTDGLIASSRSPMLLFRADGSMVAATPAGVSFLEPSGISSLYAFQGLVNNHVYALASDGARTLAGTLGGLSVLDSGLVKASYTLSESSLKHNWITRDRQAREWIFRRHVWSGRIAIRRFGSVGEPLTTYAATCGDQCERNGVHFRGRLCGNARQGIGDLQRRPGTLELFHGWFAFQECHGR